MCGIGSITLTDKASAELDLDAAVDAMLHKLMFRGRDATGVAAITSEGRIFTMKAAHDAIDFCKERPDLPDKTRAVMMHTRFATQGDKAWSHNNHPVEAGRALVCHNGMVWDAWTKRQPGAPEVDTYALSVQANANSKRLEGESDRDWARRVVLALADVDGSQAVQVAFRGQPFLISARISSSPLVISEAEGVRITASTAEAVRAGMKALGITIEKTTLREEINAEKNKNKKKKEWKVEEVECVWALREGDTLTWCAGKHDDFAVEMPKQARYQRPVSAKKPSRAGTGTGWTYASDWRYNSYPAGAPAVGASPAYKASDRLTVGTRVRINATGRIGTIKSFSTRDGMPPLYTISVDEQTYFDNSQGKTMTKDAYEGTFAHQLVSRLSVATSTTPFYPPFNVGAFVTHDLTTSPYYGKKGTVTRIAPNGIIYDVSFEMLHGESKPTLMTISRGMLRPWMSTNEKMRADRAEKEQKLLEAQKPKQTLTSRRAKQVARILGFGSEQEARQGMSEDYGVTDADYDLMAEELLEEARDTNDSLERCDMCEEFSRDWEDIEGMTLCEDCARSMSDEIEQAQRVADWEDEYEDYSGIELAGMRMHSQQVNIGLNEACDKIDTALEDLQSILERARTERDANEFELVSSHIAIVTFLGRNLAEIAADYGA